MMKLGNIQSNKNELEDIELRQMADHMESQIAKGGDVGPSISILEAHYLDTVYQRRQKSAEHILEYIFLYLGDPSVQKELSSLMDVCNNDLSSAAKYVMWYMIVLERDGISWGIRQTAAEVNKAFASMTILNGEDRFR